MSAIKSIFHLFSRFLITSSLIAVSFSAAQFVPTQALPVHHRQVKEHSQLPADDWDHIQSLLPDNVVPYSQQAYIKASNAAAEDQFGASVAIFGDTVVVGAVLEDSIAAGVNGNQADDSSDESGAVYVFVRNGTTWSQQAYLKASNNEVGEVTGDLFGASVSISGNTLVVGAPYEDSSATGVNGNQADNSAYNSGAVYVFTRSGITWSQQAYIKASNTGAEDYFGSSVAISDDTFVVGAYLETSSATGVNGDETDNSARDAGAAYVFTRSGMTWSQQAYLKASNTGEWDFFGGSVAISGNTVVVGARGEASNAVGINGDQTNNLAGTSGAVYVFTRDGTIWSQQAYLKASNTQEHDIFGSVAISGDTIAVGAFYEDSNATGVNGDQSNDLATYSGAVYIFTRNGSSWSQQAYIKASNTGEYDNFGQSVAISDNTLIVGAPGEYSNAIGVNGNQSDNSAPVSGAVYIFTRDGEDWSQRAYIKASNSEAYDFFGTSVGISNGTIVVGAPSESSNAASINGNQIDNSAHWAGAAYIFGHPLVQSSTLMDPNPTFATVVNFMVTMSEPMTGVDASDFSLTTTGSIADAQVMNVNGGPTTYNVTVAAGSGDGTIRLDVLDDDTILNIDNIPLGGEGIANGGFNAGEAYLIDRTSPTILSITRANTNPTNLTSIQFSVKFSEPVSNVDVNDFSLTTTGVGASTITSVSGTGATRNVTINTGHGNGTIRLNLIDNDSILDTALNPLGGSGTENGSFTSGQIYTIDKTVALTLKSIGSQDGWILESSENSTAGGSLNLTDTVFQIGDNTTKKQYIGILSFGTGASLPDNAIITGVELRVKKYNTIGSGNPLAIFKGFMVDIKKGFFGNSSLLQFSDFQAVTSKTYGPFYPVLEGGSSYVIKLNRAGEYINKLSSNGGLTQIRLRFRLDDNNNTIANYLSLYSGDAPAANRPQLVVMYYIP